MEASGEVAGLKDTLNEMIRNLRETTRQNVEQDWLKTNRERFTRMLQGQDNLVDRVEHDPLRTRHAGLGPARGLLLHDQPDRWQRTPCSNSRPAMAFEERRQLSTSFRLGEGLVGQCGKEKKRILLTEVPGDYVQDQLGARQHPLPSTSSPCRSCSRGRCAQSSSSLRSPRSRHPPDVPRLDHREHRYRPQHDPSLGPHRDSAPAGPVTGRGAPRPAGRAARVQRRSRAPGAACWPSGTGRRRTENQEIEQSKRLLEEKAAQLAISSKYKSEFIANMSHELRTPLNSLLILAEQLEDNPDNNMTETQVQYASVISTSGKELMSLLNSILDLAKVESGTMDGRAGASSPWASCETRLSASSSPLPSERASGTRSTSRRASPRRIVTDAQRLRQILKNLLANAFKFTEHGSVHIQIDARPRPAGTENVSLAPTPGRRGLRRQRHGHRDRR